MFKKVCLHYKIMCLLFPRGCKGTKNYFPVPNKKGNGNSVNLVPWLFLFVDEGEHFIRLDLEHKEVCASDWLKPPISSLLTRVLFSFYVLHSRSGFALQEAYLQFKHSIK